MKKKSAKVVAFLDELHRFITTNRRFRTHTLGLSEKQIQTELRSLIIEFLAEHFRAAGFKDPDAKANKSFYWESQEGRYGKERTTTFGTRNYPDFIITAPYLLAIEYKQSKNGSIVKQGVGQSIMHTLCGEFDYVYFLFHDQSSDKKIEKSIKNKRENLILDRMWMDYNVRIKFV